MYSYVEFLKKEERRRARIITFPALLLATIFAGIGIYSTFGCEMSNPTVARDARHDCEEYFNQVFCPKVTQCLPDQVSVASCQQDFAETFDCSRVVSERGSANVCFDDIVITSCAVFAPDINSITLPQSCIGLFVRQ